MTLVDLLQRSTEKFATRTALVTGDRSITYLDLWESVIRLGSALRRLGVKSGERVGVMLPNVPAFVQAYFGILAAGGTVVPLNVQYKAEEIRHVLEDATIQRILTNRLFEATLRDASHQLCHSLQVITMDGESAGLELGAVDAVAQTFGSAPGRCRTTRRWPGFGDRWRASSA